VSPACRGCVGNFQCQFGHVNACVLGFPLCREVVSWSRHNFALNFRRWPGTALKRVLAPGESVTIDTFSLVAYEKTVAMEVVPVGGCVMMCCGGSGMYNTKLTGPGTIVIASMPPKKMKAGMVCPDQQLAAAAHS
jgi:hypothetical protein